MRVSVERGSTVLQRCKDPGGEDKTWDRETMFSQLTKRSASQWLLERAETFFAINSPASGGRVQC